MLANSEEMSRLGADIQDHKFRDLVSTLRSSLNFDVDRSRWRSFLVAVEQGAVAIDTYATKHANDLESEDSSNNGYDDLDFDDIGYHI